MASTSKTDSKSSSSSSSNNNNSGGGEEYKINLHAIQAALIGVAKQASKLILNAKQLSTTGTETGTKKNSADLVTETDKAVEDLVSKTLLEKFPNFKFLGEETYKPGTKLGPEPTFVVDPIDGTTNFVHGWPYVSISLGFAVNREPTVGVVYNPFTRKLYTGIKGEGSFLYDDEYDNEEDIASAAPRSSGLPLGSSTTGGVGVGRKRKLPLRSPEDLQGLDSTLVAVEWGSDRSGNNWKVKSDTFRRLGASKEEGGAMVHSARALGSAALNLCAVAEGRIDLYWEGGCWAWDVCAAWVILTEAGGLIVDGNPSGQWEIPVDHRKYLAVRGGSSKEGQKKIVEDFWSFIDGKLDYES